MSEAKAAKDLPEAELPERRANRPVTPLHYVEYAAMRTLMGSFRLLGVDTASYLAGKFMRAIGPLIRPVSRRAEDNLAMIYPDWSKDRINTVMRDLWENLGRTAGEFAHLDKLTKPDRVDIVGMDQLEEIKASGKPAVLVSGHFANWEVIPATMQASGLYNGFVYRAANNPLTDELIIRHRGKVMTHYQIPKGDRGGRKLVECFAQGRSLMMLVDQKLNTGIPAPLLGKRAMTGTAAAKLALKYQAPVYYVSIERLEGAHFRMTVHQPVTFNPTGDNDYDVTQLTEKINVLLGRDIDARPSQWLWFHRRWPKE